MFLGGPIGFRVTSSSSAYCGEVLPHTAPAEIAAVAAEAPTREGGWERGLESKSERLFLEGILTEQQEA